MDLCFISRQLINSHYPSNIHANTQIVNSENWILKCHDIANIYTHRNWRVTRHCIY